MAAVDARVLAMLRIKLGGATITMANKNRRYVVCTPNLSKALFKDGVHSITDKSGEPRLLPLSEARRMVKVLNAEVKSGQKFNLMTAAHFSVHLYLKFREDERRNEMTPMNLDELNLSAIHRADNGDGSFNLRIDEDVLAAPKTNGVVDTFDALGEAVPGAVNYTPEVIAEVDDVEGGSLDELSDDPFLDPVVPEDAAAVSVERLTQEMLNAPFIGNKSYNVPEPKFIKLAPEQEHTLLEVAVRNYIDAVRKLEEVRKLAQLDLGTNGESYDAAIEDELNLLCNAEYNGVSITEITKNLIGYQRMRRALKANERILSVLKTFEILPAGNSQAMEELEEALAWGKEGDCIPVSAPVQFAKKHGEF